MKLASPRLTSDGIRQELQRFAKEFAKGQLHEELQVLGNRIEQAIHQAIRQQQEELGMASLADPTSSDPAGHLLMPITEELNSVYSSEAKIANSGAGSSNSRHPSTVTLQDEELGWFHRPRRVSVPPDLAMDSAFAGVKGHKKPKDKDEKRKKRVSVASSISIEDGGEMFAARSREDAEAMELAKRESLASVTIDAEDEHEVHQFMLRHRRSYFAPSVESRVELGGFMSTAGNYNSGAPMSTAATTGSSSTLEVAASGEGTKTAWWKPASDAQEEEVEATQSYTYAPLLTSGSQPTSDLEQLGTSDTDENSAVEHPDPEQESGKARWGRPTPSTIGTKRASALQLLLPLRFEQRTGMADVVQSSTYAYLTGIFIVASSASIGIQTDYMARHWIQEAPRPFRICDQIFCALFVVDIFMRVCGLGVKFWTNQDWRWNILDLLVTTVQVVEETVYISSDFAKHVGGDFFFGFISILRTLRIFRMIRVLRLVRIVRVLNLVGELRMILVSVLDGLRSLCWTIFVLTLLVYVVGVYLTQTVTDLKVRDQDGFVGSADARALEEFFGTLDRSMLSLYETISDGIHWHEIIGPLRRTCSPWLCFLFGGYIAFVMFAMLNVVTGVFVESAIQAANDDKKKVLMYQIRSLFISADVDESGTITWEEFKDILGNAQMQMYLRAIDLGEEEARELFRLLDIDDTGEIEFEEFVNGCLRLHGLAKSLDLAAFMHEYRRSSRVSSSQMQRIESKLTRVLTYVNARTYRPSHSLSATGGLSSRNTNFSDRSTEIYQRPPNELQFRD